MEGISFWHMVDGWHPFGQWLFCLIIFVGSLNFLLYLCRYIAIWIHGWPLHDEEDE